MTKEEIFEVVKTKVLEVLNDVKGEDVTPDRSLSELGANSVDRVEVAMGAMEQLDLRIPRVQLYGVTNLAELVEVFHRHLSLTRQQELK